MQSFDYEDGWASELSIISTVLTTIIHNITKLTLHPQTTTTAATITAIPSSSADTVQSLINNCRILPIVSIHLELLSCDVRYGLHHPSNLSLRHCSSRFLLFSFVLAENAVLLRESSFQFMIDVFKVMSSSGDFRVILCMDSTHKLWTEVCQIGQSSGWTGSVA